MKICREDLIKNIEAFIRKETSAEELGWWAFDLLVDSKLELEPGYERILRDIIHSIHYFHDTDPVMSQFYPEMEDLIYFLRCLKGEELYSPKRVPQWKV